VLFEKRLQNGLRDGSIRLVFRRWRRPQVVAGRRYHSPIGLVEVDAIALADEPISAEDAAAAGYGSPERLLADLKGSADAPLYRIELHASREADPRDELARAERLGETELARLQQRLARLDRGRAWTVATLRAIQERPGTRAGDLAVDLGWQERQEFKLQVRKLKALGLTLSLPVGYRLAPRGQAYLDALAEAERHV
jgi:hypothetical protein